MSLQLYAPSDLSLREAIGRVVSHKDEIGQQSKRVLDEAYGLISSFANISLPVGVHTQELHKPTDQNPPPVNATSEISEGTPIRNMCADEFLDVPAGPIKKNLDCK